MFIVSLSGNSGCGKSTMLKALHTALKQEHEFDACVFDESLFHHPQLSRMFERPQDWALPIQVNFLLQRAAALLRLVESRPETLVLMERSIEEDELFFDYYVERGHIEMQARDAYRVLQRHFASRLPAVGCNIYLRGEVPILQARIEQDMEDGRRPRELAGVQLARYLEDIGRIYDVWAAEKRRLMNTSSLWLEGHDVTDVGRTADVLMKAFQESLHA